MSDQMQTAAVTAPVVEDMEKRTRQFIEVRDKLKALDDAHKANRQPLVEIQEVLAGKIQAFMATNRLENLKTTAGTCYTTTRRTASLADPDAFMKFVITNLAWDLLDRRANSTAVQDFVNQHKSLPPGVNLSAIETVGVRRAGGSNKTE